MWNITDAAYAELTKEAVIEIEVYIRGARGQGNSTTLFRVGKLLEDEGFIIRKLDDSSIVKLQGARLPRKEFYPYGR